MTVRELADTAAEIASRDPHREVVISLEECYISEDCEKCSNLGHTEKAVTGLLWIGRNVVVSTE